MAVIKFKKDCFVDGNFYGKDEILENIKELDMKTIWKLNEKGFIFPLTIKEFKSLENKENKISKKYLKEEE